MKKIKELFFDNKDVNGEVGIEVEVEGKNLPFIDSPVWRTEGDGSLRADESYEHVLNKPVPRNKIAMALAELNIEWEKSKAIIEESPLAGVHIHINVRELTVSQVITFACLYYVYEESLLNFCGEKRKGNHFCLSTKDAEWVLFKVEEAVREDNLESLFTDEIRYSSLNFKALLQYGSLEFRGMRSTPDVKMIQQWAEMLLCIKDYAIGVATPKDVVALLSQRGEDRLFQDIFGNTDVALINVKEGMRRIQSLAYCKDWEEEKEEKIVIKFKAEEEKAPVEEVMEKIKIGRAQRIREQAAEMEWVQAPPPIDNVADARMAPAPNRIEVAMNRDKLIEDVVWEGL